MLRSRSGAKTRCVTGWMTKGWVYTWGLPAPGSHQDRLYCTHLSRTWRGYVTAGCIFITHLKWDNFTTCFTKMKLGKKLDTKENRDGDWRGTADAVIRCTTQSAGVTQCDRLLNPLSYTSTLWNTELVHCQRYQWMSLERDGEGWGRNPSDAAAWWHMVQLLN